MQSAIKFDANRLLLPVSIDLQDKLSEIIIKSGRLNDKTRAVTVNLRDKGYSAESGGWHPVEIRISRCGELWQFEYLTEGEVLIGKVHARKHKLMPKMLPHEKHFAVGPVLCRESGEARFPDAGWISVPLLQAQFMSPVHGRRGSVFVKSRRRPR